MEDQQERPPGDVPATQPEVVATKEPAILETPEDIRNRRNQVLDRYAAFKEATDERRRRLEDAKRYQYFKRDADELENWIQEKLQTYTNEDFKDLTNLQVCSCSRFLIPITFRVKNKNIKLLSSKSLPMLRPLTLSIPVEKRWSLNNTMPLKSLG